MFQVQFYVREGVNISIDIESDTDAAVEKARETAEEVLGKSLRVDPRHDFPSFFLYKNENGDLVELGGG